jgi:hypothetical protein
MREKGETRVSNQMWGASIAVENYERQAGAVQAYGNALAFALYGGNTLMPNTKAKTVREPAKQVCHICGKE